ncbi:zinc metalloproteinase nas-13-like [Antedon mediterranea]|uniref:zinc metalloproteinase nas-13-like n=1 Tax=Antedon mediterranea TaxID=105859 RepID=UPI003AF5C062
MQYVILFACLLMAVASSPVPGPKPKIVKHDGLFSTIIKNNKRVNQDNLFEGDIVLTGSSKNALKDKSKRWHNGVVPYVIHYKLNAFARSQIQKAIDRYNAETCIKWVARTSESKYVKIVDKDRCSSYVGVIGGVQELSLGYGCYQTVGIIMHEMMHAIGFYHEQSRTDRDSYVSIQWQNIEDGQEHNFKSYPSSYIDDLGVSYDYHSIMHYDADAFSKNGDATIIPKESGVTIGNRADFSSKDIEKINKYYECGCKDYRDDTYCGYWAGQGYCSPSSIYYTFMTEKCRKSCSFC